MACASLAAPSDALAQNLAPSTISARALPSDGAINGGAVPPTITMSATPSGTGHEEFALTIRFSQSVLGFREDEIGLSVGDLWDFSGSGTAYTATIEPPADYEGTITVSIAKGAAISLFDEDNAEAAYSFYVDNVAPRLYDAFVEGDELVLIYDNALTVAVAPDPRDYSVRVEGRIRDVTRVQVRGDEVTLILNPAVRFRDEVVVSYTPGTRPLSDAVGNVVDALVREPVTNRTSENAGVPSAPRSLSAYAARSSVIELDWTAPADPGSAVVDGYRIEVSSDGGSTWDVLERDTRNAVTSYRHTGLLSHSTRHYRVSAINNFGVSEPSNTASATTTGRVPAAPTGLTATVFGSSRIDLRWRASSGGSGGAVTGYRIEFSDNRLSGWSTLVSDTRSTSTAYSDTGLPPGTTRYYRVSGINRAGVGSASNVDDATTLFTRPGQPTNLQATPSSTSRINLSWAEPASDGGERITGYVVESSTDGGTSWSVVVSNTGSATRYSHTGLGPGTTRHYRVAAINSRGRGQFSGTVRATTAATVPAAPTSLRATGQTPTSITLAWNAPSHNGGAAITSYRIEVSHNGISGWQLLVVTTSATRAYTVRNLQPATTRYYRVAANNREGAGRPSLPARAATAADVPSAPRNLVAEAVGPSRIDLEWDPPADDGGAPVTGYRIEVSEDRRRTWSPLADRRGANATTYSHTRLPPNTTRHYRVSAVNRAGTGSLSRVVVATTDADVPGAPTGLAAGANGASRIDLRWTAPNNTGGAPIIAYRIEVSENAERSWSDLVSRTPSARTTYSHTGLPAGSTRHYRVSAINRIGTGEPSGVAPGTTASTVPGTPTALSARADGTTRIDLSWNAPALDGGQRITGYTIEVSHNGISGWQLLVVTTSATRAYTDRSLQPATTRYYRVAAVNRKGAGRPSAPVPATTAPGAPSAPRNLVAEAVGPSRIDLEWDPPADDGAPVTGYRIEVSEDRRRTWSPLADRRGANATTYSHTRLPPNTTRHYRVSAVNRAGTGSLSRVVVATTDADVPGAPTGLAAGANGASRIDLRWTAPNNTGGAPIIAYRIEVSENAERSWSDLVSRTPSARTTYSHTGLPAGSTRHYRVSAINRIGTGEPSGVAPGTTASTVPGTPTALSARADGTTRIDLSWNVPTVDGGQRITGYTIEVSHNGISGWQLLVVTTSATRAYTDRSLQPATTRYYRVAAVNRKGAGRPSAPVPATTAPGAPSAPRNLVADGPSRIDLEWDPPAYDGGAPISGYRIEISEDRRRTWSPLADRRGANTTTYSHTRLPPNTTRHYRVSAVNRAGTGSLSRVVVATTDADVPGAPTGLAAGANGASRIDLRWTAPNNTGGAPIIAYRIEVSEDAGRSWSDLVSRTPSARTTYSHTGLPAGSTRHYRVSAINRIGTGESSRVAQATTESTVPGRPTALSATADGTSRIDLSWNAPALDGGQRITGYTIEVSADGGSRWQLLVPITSPGTTYTHRNLEPATTRHYRVAAINRVGVGSFSASNGATTAADVPSAARNLMAEAMGHSRIDLEWDPPAYDGGAPISGYRIEISEDRRRTWTLLARRGANTTSYSHTALPPNTTRHYRVSAVNRAGAGLPSNVHFATTDADLPGAPTGLEAEANGTSRIDLTWTAPSYTGGVQLIGYRIEVSQDAGRSWSELVPRTQSATTAYSHTGLRAGSTRHYRVSAINHVGAGAPSGVAGATTESTVPDRPTALSATADGTSRILLSWNAPALDGGERISGYRIEVSENGGFSWNDLNANTNSARTVYTHTGLEPGTTRHYRVSAINSVGVGDPSTVASGTTDATVPDAPTNLLATAVEATQINLTWTAPSYDGGAAISGYRIEVSQDGAAWADLVSDTRSTVTAFSHTGLQPGSTRFYRVSAINSAGTGMPSAVASASTDDPRERAGRASESILPYAAAAVTASTVSAISARIDAVATGAGDSGEMNTGGFSSLAGSLAGRTGGMDAAGLHMGMGAAGMLLDGASFVLPVRNGQQASPQRGIMSSLATWGGVEYVGLGEPGAAEVDWNGNLLNLHVGADVRVRPDVLAGVAATSSSGSFDFTDKTGENPVAGTYDSRFTTVNPYAAWMIDDAGSVAWASGGYGWGEIEIEDARTELRSAGTRMLSGAVGGSHTLLSSGPGGVRVKGEGWLSRVTVNEAAEIDSLTLDMQRLRLLLEWSQRYRSGSGDEIAFLVEGGMRYDGGSGAQGTGFEVGSGLRIVNARLGVRVEARGRLLVTGVEGYDEWGVGGILQFDPSIRDQGLSVRVAPTWGEAAGGPRELWERGVSEMRRDTDPAAGRIDAEVAYGLAGFSGTPYGGLLLAHKGSRAYSSGLRYDLLGRGLGLRVEATRREGRFGPPEHTIGIRGRVRF